MTVRHEAGWRRRETAACVRRRWRARRNSPASALRLLRRRGGQPQPVPLSCLGMGYEQGKGLGKDGQGNPEPVEIVMRPKNAGLGSVEAFKRPTKPVTVSAKENLPPWPPASTKEQQQQPRWSKKASARKAPVLTKNEALAMRAEQEQDEQPAVVQKLIDMRGPRPRVLTTLERLNDVPMQEMMAVAADDDAPVMPELQHNVRLLVDGAEADVARLDGRLRREREAAASLAREKEELSGHEASQRRQTQVMEAIAAALDRVRADEAAGALTPEALLHTFRGLKARFWEEFKMCGVAWIACQFAHPLLVQAFNGWHPLEDPSFGLELMSSWKDLLEHDQPYDFSHGAASMAPYAQLVGEVILPAVRTAGTNSWDARDPEPMLELLLRWERVLPTSVLQSVLEHVVMPKLSAAVDSWDPRREVPIHAWVHPWLDMLAPKSVQALCDSVRYKMSSALQAWQAHDRSAHALLSPWKNVFGPAIWNDLTVRCIVPKLKTALQEFQINPADQKLDRFNSVMVWAPDIPVQLMVRVLEADFFSKWQYVLYHWLCSPNPDFNEIIACYEGWKGLFPPELLANERIQAQLAIGLDMMNQAAEGLEVVEPVVRGNLGCFRASEKRQELDAAPLPRCSEEPGTAVADLSFKECIQAFAIDRGLLFKPRVGKFYSGMPVYEFGTASICLDSVKRVVYAQLPMETERWAAVSLKQLMERAC